MATLQDNTGFVVLSTQHNVYGPGLGKADFNSRDSFDVLPAFMEHLSEFVCLVLERPLPLDFSNQLLGEDVET